MPSQTTQPLSAIARTVSKPLAPSNSAIGQLASGIDSGGTTSELPANSVTHA